MNKERSKNYSLRCISPPPLLFMISSLFSAILIPILLIILFLIIIFLIKKKIKKEEVFDKNFKKHFLWILPPILYLASFFILSHNNYGHYLYVISFLFLSVSILGVIFIAEKYKIFKTAIILKALFVIFFIGTFIISVIKTSQAYEDWRGQVKEKDQFEKIISELSHPPGTERTSFHGTSITNYSVYLDENESVGFYKSNISPDRWQFLEEKTGKAYHYLRYKKTDKDLWLGLNFTWSGEEDKEDPITFLNIGVSKFKPTGTINLINPLGSSDFCGGGHSLF